MTTTTAAYLAVNQNLARYQAMTAAEPAVKTATAYYQANIGKATSIQAFVGNYRLLSYALDAYGLGDQINNTALITKVLEGGVTNPKSLANTLPNANWKAFATAFNFVGQGAASVSSASAVKTTTSDYVEQQLESDQGAQDVGVQLALYFQRVAPTVTSEYGILADPNLLEVAQTIFGLSPDTSASGIDAQAQTLSKLMPLSDLQDPKKLAAARHALHRHVRPRLRARVGVDLVADRLSGNSSSARLGGLVDPFRRDQRQRPDARHGAQRLHRRLDADVLDLADVEPAAVQPRRVKRTAGGPASFAPELSLFRGLRRYFRLSGRGRNASAAMGLRQPKSCAEIASPARFQSVRPMFCDIGTPKQRADPEFEQAWRPRPETPPRIKAGDRRVIGTGLGKRPSIRPRARLHARQ